MESEPAEWQPQVVQFIDSVVVVFYSLNVVGSRDIHQHIDTYVPDSYAFETEEKTVAYEIGGIDIGY